MHIKIYIFVNIFLEDHAHTKPSSSMMSSEQFFFQRAGAGGKGRLLLHKCGKWGHSYTCSPSLPFPSCTYL